jgi:hypothetical protein
VERAIYLDCSEDTMQERFRRAGVSFGIWGILSQPSIAVASSSVTLDSDSTANLLGTAHQFDASRQPTRLDSSEEAEPDNRLPFDGSADGRRGVSVHRSHSDSHAVLSSFHRRHLNMLEEVVLDVRSRTPRRQVFSASNSRTARPTLTEVKAAKSEQACVSSTEVQMVRIVSALPLLTGR